MARRYNRSPRIAHVVSSGNRVRGSRESELKRLKEAAEIVAESAREISSRFSRRIPLSVRVVTSNTRAYVEAGGDIAPQAYPFDPPPSEVPGRHPLWAQGPRSEWRWTKQPYRPFLEQAAEEAADRAAEAFSKVVDDWCHDTGLTKG